MQHYILLGQGGQFELEQATKALLDKHAVRVTFAMTYPRAEEPAFELLVSISDEVADEIEAEQKLKVEKVKDADRLHALTQRPVAVVEHDRVTGEFLGGIKVIGDAQSRANAVRLARDRGFRVPNERTPGYSWDNVPAEVAKTDRDCFGVPILV